MTAPTSTAKHLLLILRDGQHLVRHAQGWRVVTGAGFERIDGAVVKEAVARGWIIHTQWSPETLAWVITDEGRKALEAG